MTLATSYNDRLFTNLFPRSGAYRRVRQDGSSIFREERPHDYSTPLSERHVQCIWYDARLRPDKLRNHLGEEITVVEPGRWNLEAGPDFLDAVLRIGPQQRLVSGDVEIHTHPRDWQHHRHEHDPRYQGVRAHVTYYPGTLPASTLPHGTHQVALKPALDEQNHFFINDIDVTAYPIEMAQRPERFRVFETWSVDQKILLIEAAGEERLRHKSECFAQHTEYGDVRQCVYESIMSAMGYKNNKGAFLHVAQALPLDRLELEAGADATLGYALLMGIARLLPDEPMPSWDDTTQDFARSLWDLWWPRRAAMEDLVGDSIAWRRPYGRPTNNPQRRMYAAAQLFCGRPNIFDVIKRACGRGSDCMSTVIRHLVHVDAGYWGRRLSLGGTLSSKPTALIGEGRAASIVLNVIVPYAASQGWKHVIGKASLDTIPAEPTNVLIRDTAAALFGPEHSPRHWRSGLRQQGLLQLYQDFYLNDRSHEILLSCPPDLAPEGAVSC